MSGDFFTYDMDAEATVVLSKVRHDLAKQDSYELYFSLEDDYQNVVSVEPVCGSCPTEETQFDILLKNLYDTVADSCKNVNLSPRVRSIIDRFLGDRPSSADDDELPF